jgi:hypothetical protein
MSLKINKRQFKKWIAALDSGEYKQGVKRMHYIENDVHRYCCLGIGCKVLIRYKLLLFDALDNRRIKGGVPFDQVLAPLWLKDINYDFEDKTGKSLSELNDHDGFTFPEIATLLELVYIHKILD